MKKLFVLFLLLIVVPLNVQAASIERTNITGGTTAKVGEKFSLSYNINFSGIQKGSADSLGIAAVGYELVFDDNVFEVTNITSESNVWDSEIYKENGKYYVLSMITEYNKDMNKCINGVLYCADYIVSIEFSVKDTAETETSILIGNVEVALLNMLDTNKTYTEEDILNNAITIQNTTYESRVITIKNNNQVSKNETIKVEEKHEADKKNEVNNTNITSNKITTTKKEETTDIKKSNNKYISSLTVENYEINFDKEITNYDLIVENDVNSLNLNVELEDSKATYKIKGAYNLLESDYKVSIVVTAENGEKNTYTINVKLKDQNVIEEVEDKSFKIDSKYIKIGVIIGGIILIIIIVVIIINHINNKKIDKAFDDI